MERSLYAIYSIDDGVTQRIVIPVYAPEESAFAYAFNWHAVFPLKDEIADSKCRWYALDFVWHCSWITHHHPPFWCLLLLCMGTGHPIFAGKHSQHCWLVYWCSCLALDTASGQFLVLAYFCSWIWPLMASSFKLIILRLFLRMSLSSRSEAMVSL